VSLHASEAPGAEKAEGKRGPQLHRIAPEVGRRSVTSPCCARAGLPAKLETSAEGVERRGWLIGRTMAGV